MAQAKAGKSLIKALLRVLATRVELFSLELSEEKDNLGQVLVWAVLCGAFLVMFAITVLGLLLALVWDTPYKYWYIGACIFLFAAGAAWALATLKKLIFGRVPFAMTIDELKTDINALKDRD